MRELRWALAVLISLILAAPAGAQSDPIGSAMDRKDFAEARRLSEEWAKSGAPDAFNNLAVFLRNGVGGVADPERATELLEKAVALGSVAAKANLALQLIAEGDPDTYPRAVGLLRDVRSDPRMAKVAAYPLGRLILFGMGVPRDMKVGVDLLEEALAADPAQSDAYFLVARAYENGWGGRTPDQHRATALFKLAADRGDNRANRPLGLAALNGAGSPKDPKAALNYFRRGAEGGDRTAMIDVAVMLAVGEGVAPDPPQARIWYRKSAVAGSAHGLAGLGYMLLHGEGGPADVPAGVAYLEIAASAGYAPAAVSLSELPDLGASERSKSQRIKGEWLSQHGPPKAD